jgi:holo-[acyl-carrier protein] synthase
VGSGIDIVEVERVEKTLRRFGDRFEQRTFSAHEIAACRQCPRRVSCLAARFAAKEAAMKALGTGWRRGVRFRDIEVAVSPGRPERLRLRGRAAEIARDRGGERWHVAVSAGRQVAVAVVLLEADRTPGEAR